MPDWLALALIAVATVLATGLGAVPVALLGARAAALQPVLSGVAAGVMAVAATVGLIAPALRDGDDLVVAIAVAAGVAGLFWSRSALHHHLPVTTAAAAAQRRSLLVIGVLLVHSFPEGLAIGSAYASTTAGLGAFVIAAIAIQNVPEGTATAIPVRAAGGGALRQIGAAVLTSVPQVPGALIAWLAVEEVRGLLPISFALAGGAMLALVVVDTAPDAWRSGSHRDVAGGGAIGVAGMVAISLLLGV